MVKVPVALLSENMEISFPGDKAKFFGFVIRRYAQHSSYRFDLSIEAKFQSNILSLKNDSRLILMPEEDSLTRRLFKKQSPQTNVFKRDAILSISRALNRQLAAQLNFL
jgi:hypothetical protein